MCMCVFVCVYVKKNRRGTEARKRIDVRKRGWRVRGFRNNCWGYEGWNEVYRGESEGGKRGTKGKDERETLTR